MSWNNIQVGIKKSKKRFSNTLHNALPADAVDRNQQRFRKTTKLCSCRGCGNQRQWEGPTIQELKWIDCANEQVIEFTNGYYEVVEHGHLPD